MIALFVLSSFLFALNSQTFYRKEVNQCRTENDAIQLFLFYYFVVTTIFAILLLFVLIVRVITFSLNANEDKGHIKMFISKMVLYGYALFSALLDYMMFMLKEKYFTFGWVYSAKVVECLLGCCLLVMFGYNRSKETMWEKK